MDCEAANDETHTSYSAEDAPQQESRQTSSSAEESMKTSSSAEESMKFESSVLSATPATTATESEDAHETCRLPSPPGLGGSQPWDAWDEEGARSPLNKDTLGEHNCTSAPPGLGGGLSGELSNCKSGLPYKACAPSWCSPMPEKFFGMAGSFSDCEDAGTLQATSLQGTDWKSLFPENFVEHEIPQKWQPQEPAMVHPSDVIEEDTTAAEDPIYVKALPGVALESQNELLAAENARLAMENEFLRGQYMFGVNPDIADMSPASYWSDGSQHDMDMAWGMNPFFPNAWCPMMPMPYGHMEVPRWTSGGKQRSSRARTDSDVGQLAAAARVRTSSGDLLSRSRSMSDAPRPPEGVNTGSFTTVMLRNLPNNYSRTMLLKLIDVEGFGGQYDFIYLPMDFKSHASLGYAFVNLVDPVQATLFFETFEGFHRWVVPSQKVCSVNWSHPYQGLEAHIERYRNSPVMHEDVPDEYKPMVFQNGERVAFPPPTKKLKVPRMRPGSEKSTLAEGVVAEE